MIYDVYGYGEPSLGDQPGKLAEALGVEWVRHESDYRGIYFVARPRSPDSIGRKSSASRRT